MPLKGSLRCMSGFLVQSEASAVLWGSEVVVAGLDIRGGGLAIPLTDELEGAVVGEPAREAARKGVALLGRSAGADIRQEHCDAGDGQHILTRPGGAMCLSLR